MSVPAGEQGPSADERRDELEERLETLTGFVGGILFEIDRKGRYVEVLTGEPGLLAAPVGDLLRRSITDFLPPDLSERLLAAIARSLDTGRPEQVRYVLDVQAGRRSFRAEIRPTARRPTSSRARTVTVLTQDITAETELRAKLVEAERLAGMGLVAASIGHELRQPLAYARTSIEVLARELDRLEVNALAHEAFSHVRDALERMEAIASNVGVVASARERDSFTDVRRPILAAVDLCASELQGRATVSLEVPELSPVTIAEGELCQVITNLLLNAAQAAQAEGRISVRAADAGESVRITIADDGAGIDPAIVDKIFDPFFTTKAPGRGNGLGLFVSRRLVEAAGGSLRVSSWPGQGTQVSLSVPKAAPRLVSPVTAASASASGPAGGGHVEPRRLRVLVIDDEPSFGRSLELVLEPSHDVTVCSRSLDALALVREDPARFDVVLCDLSMPELDGVAFYEQLESLGLADRFVLMTAGAFTPRTEAFLRTVRCRRIAKPFSPEALLSLLTM